MKRKGALLKRRDGMTMVEVIVAFLILTIILAAFSQAAVLTGRMVQYSEMRLQENRNLAGSCYLDGQEDPEADKAEAVSPLIQPITLLFQAETGQFFEIPAEVRRFDGQGGSLYDVTGIHWEE